MCDLIPLDPSLTPANILRATHDIPLWRSGDSYYYLDMPQSQHDEIAGRLDGEQAKLELFTTWLDSHPCPTWEHVRDLLTWVESNDRGAADEVEETYIKSELHNLLSDDYLQTVQL